MAKISIDSLIEFGETFTRKNLANIPELQMNLVMLPAYAAVPGHDANSNVRLLVLQGRLTVELAGQVTELGVHEMANAAPGTPMQIKNLSDANTAFLVIKTPNPDV